MEASGWSAVVVARTGALLESHGSIDVVVAQLRREGFGLAESIAGLIKVAGMSPFEARAAVAESPVWADMGERKHTPRNPNAITFRVEAIEPPDPPDEDMIERLRLCFDGLPRITEAWVIGQRLTPSDGSPSYETSDIVLVLDPPLPKENTRTEISALEMELEQAGYRREPDRGWVFTDTTFSPKQRQARQVYSRVRHSPPLT